MTAQSSYLVRDRPGPAPLAIAGAGAFTAVSAVAAPGSGGFETVGGLLCGAALAAFGGFLFWRGVRRTVEFSVDPHGVRLGGMLGMRHVPWRDVERMTTFYEVSGEPFDAGTHAVFVELRDGKALTARFSARCRDDAHRRVDRRRLREAITMVAPGVPVADEPDPQWIYDREAQLSAASMQAYLERRARPHGS